MAIRAVLFDMGNTLIKFYVKTEAEVFCRILLSLGISKSTEEIERAIVKTKQEAKAIGLPSLFGKLRREEFWNRWDSLVLKHLGITEHAELGKAVQSKWFDFLVFTPYPEAKGVLMELQEKGLKLGLVSTAYEEDIRFFLERTGLERRAFDTIVGVDTIRKAKPDPDIFRHAINKLNVKPEETIFVGDSVEADCKGAESAGLRALLIDRAEKQKQSGLRTIRNLKELLLNVD